MFRRPWILIAALCTLLAFQVEAAGGDALIASLKPTGSITDHANLLSPKTESRLRGVLADLEEQTTAEIAVVTLSSMEGGQIDDFTNRLFEKWGVGQADKDNGVMLLVAEKERKMRIEVGYGLEAVIPDGVAGSIRDQYILAYFKQNQMEKGIEAGTLKLAELIANHYGKTIDAKANKPKKVRRQRSDDFWSGLVFFLLFAAYVIHLIIKGHNDDDWGGGSYGRRRRYSGGWYTGGIGGRSSGGFGGGGGFSGGSFGGGMSGGGGASGGW